ncbi:protein-export chaperone SecB [Granulicella sp. S156]|uniref:protein-export chaperone SecB n=1 Tax=Granulicella sp. S156 TaxID=1747224 RepID=UPI00131E6B08|nr:protein-export chaperone SecB [Granulicella sp. S156]
MAIRKKAPPASSLVTDSRMAFIKTVKFTGLGLDEASVSIDRLTLAQISKKDDTVNTEIDIDQKVIAHEDDFFVVAVDFELIQRAKGSEAPLLSIKARFSALFRLTERASEESVSRFASLEARLVFFPYLRHFVSDISYRMAIDPIVLPMTSEL